MTQEEAVEIADNWKYPEPYSFYNMTADKEDYDEIIDSGTRGENFFSVISNSTLLGFFCVFSDKDNTEEAEVDIGMRPDLTGKGLGLRFTNVIIEYLEKNLKISVIWFSVAKFNKRAIKVYERAGFHCIKEKLQKTNGSEYAFIVMKRG
ncbi:MAG: GNAT family N-acetyltransferase [Tetragenococcus halophilus]|nr:GNAT family N-acetyltransferase [Tetragenococcus halophilus]